MVNDASIPIWPGVISRHAKENASSWMMLSQGMLIDLHAPARSSLSIPPPCRPDPAQDRVNQQGIDDQRREPEGDAPTDISAPSYCERAEGR
jgi:hypothetical protein